MSELEPDRRATEHFLNVVVPELFTVTNQKDIGSAFHQYMGRILAIAGDRGEFESRFDWDSVPAIALDMAASHADYEHLKLREGEERAVGTTVWSLYPFDFDALEPKKGIVKTTGRGTLLGVNGTGVIQYGSSIPNPLVDKAYGDPTPYVLEKLGWAKLIEVMEHQGADWGDGYKALTEYLRITGRIGSTALPHIGMATEHRDAMTENNKGRDRVARAYGSASNYTLTTGSVGRLLRDPRFFELYQRDMNRGLFTNIEDWLAGRMDTLVAHRVNRMYLDDGAYSTAIPDLLYDPDFVDVDNN